MDGSHSMSCLLTFSEMITLNARRSDEGIADRSSVSLSFISIAKPSDSLISWAGVSFIIKQSGDTV